MMENQAYRQFRTRIRIDHLLLNIGILLRNHDYETLVTSPFLPRIELLKEKS